MRNVSLFSLQPSLPLGLWGWMPPSPDVSRCAFPHPAVPFSGVSNSLSLTLTTVLVSRVAIAVQHKLGGLHGGNGLPLRPRLQASGMKALSGLSFHRGPWRRLPSCIFSFRCLCALLRSQQCNSRYCIYAAWGSISPFPCLWL